MLQFYIKYLLKSSWFDTRLTFFNLKRSSEQNLLSPESRGLIWVPQLQLDNTDSNIEAEYDNKAFIKEQYTDIDDWV